MVHSNVSKFEKICLSGTLIIIRKPKVWRTNRRTDMRIPIYPRLSSSVGIKNHQNTTLSEQFLNLTKIIEIEAKSIPLTHIYITTHFPGLVQALQKKWQG